MGMAVVQKNKALALQHSLLFVFRFSPAAQVHQAGEAVACRIWACNLRKAQNLDGMVFPFCWFNLLCGRPSENLLANAFLRNLAA